MANHGEARGCFHMSLPIFEALKTKVNEMDKNGNNNKFVSRSSEATTSFGHLFTTDLPLFLCAFLSTCQVPGQESCEWLVGRYIHNLLAGSTPFMV